MAQFFLMYAPLILVTVLAIFAGILIIGHVIDQEKEEKLQEREKRIESLFSK